MVVGEIVAAGGGDGLQLVVRQGGAELAAGCRERVMELIIRIIHLVCAKCGLEAALVEAGIVRDQRQPFDVRLDLLPHIREDRRVLRVAFAQPVDALAEPLIILRLRVDQRVEFIRYLAVAHHDDADGADARRAFVRGLEIYCGEVEHNSGILPTTRVQTYVKS